MALCHGPRASKRPRTPAADCWKIIKIVSTRCQILRLKCTKFDFAGGAYSAPPDPLDGFKGPTSKGRERMGR